MFELSNLAAMRSEGTVPIYGARRDRRMGAVPGTFGYRPRSRSPATDGIEKGLYPEPIFGYGDALL